MQLKFSVCLVLVCFALAAGGGVLRAQTTSPVDGTVKQSLLSLITELQAKFDRQVAGDQGAFVPQGPINPGLKALGRPVGEVALSAPVAAQGLLNFNARVVHEHGASDWQLGALDDGQIATYAYTITNLGTPISANSTINRHSSIDNLGPGAGVGSTVGGYNSILNRLSDILASAKSISQLPPPPPLPSAAALPPPVTDPRVVEFLFATTRVMALQPASGNASYNGERGPLTFGAASVRIPDHHAPGHIELPSSWKLFGLNLSSAPNEQTHFIIKRVVPLSDEEFGQVIAAKGAKTALVFVHGFNTTFQDAVYRKAQIIWDLQYPGLSVLFTWASRGELADYVYDSDSAYLARDAFIALLIKLRRDYGIEQVSVLAHSMGNLVAIDALANYARTSTPIQIAHLVMAAPDVDRDQFVALAPVAKAIVGGMTLYASSADRAMIASRTLAGGIPRAGDVPATGPIILPSIETVDVTAVGDELFGLNHDVFATSPNVMEDMTALLLHDMPPPRLSQIRAVPAPPSPPQYWRYSP
jgi:esterase/lipase superfamily enzyme